MTKESAVIDSAATKNWHVLPLLIIEIIMITMT